MGFIATLVGMLFIPYWLDEYSSEVVHMAQWFMLIAPSHLLGLVFVFALQAREEFTLYNAIRYLPPLLTLLALGLLTLMQKLTPFSAALCYVLPTIPIQLWLMVRLWRLYEPVWRDLGSAFKRLVSYGLRSYGVDLLGTLLLWGDQVLVVGLLSPSEMGLYVVALSMSHTLHVLPTAVVSVLFPKASGRPVEEVAALTERAARISTTITLLAAGGIAFLGPWALGLLYGQGYVDATPVFRLLLAEVVLSGTTWVLAHAFMAIGRPGIVSILQGVGVGLAVPLLLVLVPRYGLEGAGLALLISTVARFTFVIISFPLIAKVRAPRLWLKRSDIFEVITLLSERRKD
jgi:O-antigen/teichoic acid export membrane protein